MWGGRLRKEKSAGESEKRGGGGKQAVISGRVQEKLLPPGGRVRF